ncbi:hypothetical protein [Ruminiclostridium cellulolyticum]|uniref:Uncharacterized protein n=1 Tax=Ruminiclostridium cellulolyticum (strain ATCC 35319 / DSM 5812 / JCM 6584 / H10) TaxID=394503 RepID=B8I5X4_RUMCH|nr:hypothetical protein [Ruminiclostridium cellulolyticum]ACL74791.1 hypothetical protein Ccel_0407 [Ruminiclostridium cellulolyticum H10]
MLNKNNKKMFLIMLIPLYLLISISIFGMSIGGINWISALEYSLLFILAAWSLSRNDSLIINLAGFLIYAIIGGNSIYSTLTRTTRIGPWTFSIYTGVALILFGLLAFSYNTVRVVRKR